MEHLAFERWARLLLIGHAGIAMALAGASTHLALGSIKLLRGGVFQTRLVRIYGQTIGALYLAVFACGLIVYPTYRYYVRGLYLDRYFPAASNLFDMKENLAALGLPLALALFMTARRFDPKTEPGAIPVLAVLSLAVWGLVLFSTISGLYVTCIKGV